MVTEPQDPVAREVWETLQHLNRAWLEGRDDELAEVLHEDMVITPPGMDAPVRGREACLEGFRTFIQRASVLEFHEGPPAVDVFGDTAVVTYPYELTYEMEGSPYRDAGHDIYVFVRRDEGWCAVWRTLIPQAEEDEG